MTHPLTTKLLILVVNIARNMLCIHADIDILNYFKQHREISEAYLLSLIKLRLTVKKCLL